VTAAAGETTDDSGENSAASAGGPKAEQYVRSSSGPGEFSPNYVAQGDSLPMPPKRIERVLRRGLEIGPNGEVRLKDPKDRQFFARIYSFSYEGHYYRLPRPLLFLVNKPGTPVGGDRVDGTKRQHRNAARGGEERRGSWLPPRFSATFTGVEARDWDFSADILVWAVDRKDLTVCLDVEIGNYQEILLDSMIASDRRDEDRATRSRGDLIGRGAGSFRGDMIGPHQNK
jgi:hypothetical protein